MTRNTLSDLNNHLFEQLERLNDEGLTNDQLEKEVTRSKHITGLANQIINNGKLVLDAQKFKDERIDRDTDTPRMLEG